MKTILITGASSGIGRATALESARHRMRVIACGRNQQRLADLQSQHSSIETLCFDVTDLEQCKCVLAGHSPDIVLLNAGTCEYVDVAHFDSTLVRRVFEANLFGATHCLEALLPSMRRGSQLVFVDSLARLLPFTRSQAYGASKAALRYMAKSLEVDLADRAIKVQTLSPGFVETPLTAQNDFAMPQQITAEDAARQILRMIECGTRNGYFPARFAWMLRMMAFLPDALQVALCGKLKTDASSQSKVQPTTTLK